MKAVDAPVAGRKLWKILVPVAVILVAAAIGGGLYLRSRRAATHLTEKDRIVLAEFTNTTGDSVFDGTLRKPSITWKPGQTCGPTIWRITGLVGAPHWRPS